MAKRTQAEKEYLSKFWKGKKKTKSHALNIKLAKLGEKNPMYGVKPSKETLEKRSKALKGKKAWNKGLKLPHLSGANAPGWKGGITPINEGIRHSLEYRLWREAVFLRDNYTCRFCGQRGGNLEADHVKPFAYFPELRFAIDNGRTLCHDCHTKTDTYRRKQ